MSRVDIQFFGCRFLTRRVPPLVALNPPWRTCPAATSYRKRLAVENCSQGIQLLNFFRALPLSPRIPTSRISRTVQKVIWTNIHLSAIKHDGAIPLRSLFENLKRKPSAVSY